MDEKQMFFFLISGPKNRFHASFRNENYILAKKKKKNLNENYVVCYYRRCKLGKPRICLASVFYVVFSNVFVYYYYLQSTTATETPNSPPHLPSLATTNPPQIIPHSKTHP